MSKHDLMTAMKYLAENSAKSEIRAKAARMIESDATISTIKSEFRNTDLNHVAAIAKVADYSSWAAENSVTDMD